LCDDDSSSSLPCESGSNQIESQNQRKKAASVVSNWSEVSKIFEEAPPAAKHDRQDFLGSDVKLFLLTGNLSNY
jgi:hypothetical protein